jgi:hypothetical protein
MPAPSEIRDWAEPGTIVELGTTTDANGKPVQLYFYHDKANGKTVAAVWEGERKPHVMNHVVSDGSHAGHPQLREAYRRAQAQHHI